MNGLSKKVWTGNLIHGGESRVPGFAPGAPVVSQEAGGRQRYKLNTKQAYSFSAAFVDRINKKFSVKLKAAIFEDDALQADLMALIGDRFAEFFETDVKLSVREGFDAEIYRVVSPEEIDALRTWARQYKPSIR